MVQKNSIQFLWHQESRNSASKKQHSITWQLFWQQKWSLQGDRLHSFACTTWTVQKNIAPTHAWHFFPSTSITAPLRLVQRCGNISPWMRGGAAPGCCVVHSVRETGSTETHLTPCVENLRIRGEVNEGLYQVYVTGYNVWDRLIRDYVHIQKCSFMQLQL